MQDVVPCYVKPFLHRKCIAGIGKQCLVNCKSGRACSNEDIVIAEDLDMFN
jgi:hypothetical protein